MPIDSNRKKSLDPLHRAQGLTGRRDGFLGFGLRVGLCRRITGPCIGAGPCIGIARGWFAVGWLTDRRAVWHEG